MTEVEQLKIDLYDVLERQALLAAEHQRLEKLKTEKLKAKQLAESKAAETAKSNDHVDLRE